MGDSGAVKAMTMPYRGELASCFRDGLQSVAKKAMRQARTEISARKFDDLGGMEPTEVLDFIKDKSFSMAGDVSDDVLKKVKQVIYNGVKNGASYKDTVYAIEKAIAPYVDLTQSMGDLAEHRLMNVVRTNISEAYNEARKAIFLDSDGFVLAFQFSAVLDNETTDWCAAGAGMDGRIFKVSNPIWDELTPPTWYQCRSILIPITQADNWDGVESEEPTAWPPEGFK